MIVARSEPESYRRACTTAALASAAHGLVVFALRLSATPPPFGGSGPDIQQDVEVDLVAEAEVARSAIALASPRTEEAAPERVTARIERGASSPREVEPGSSLDLAPTGASAAPVAPASSGPLVLFAPPAVDVLGRERNPFLPRSAGEAGPASTTFRSAAPEGRSAADAKRAVEGMMKAELREHDRGIGLTPEGPILAALRDATYASSSPERGRATFVAVVDAAGIVVDLRIAGANESAATKGWEDTLARAKRALVGAKLAMRGAGLTELRIAVVSEVLLPSGSEAPVAPALSASRVAITGAAPDQGVTSGVPKTVTVGTFDLSDVGARPRRVVHVRVVSSSER